MTTSKAQVFLITLEEHQLGHDLRLDCDDATVGDVLEALDSFGRERLADCRGCDGCCHERAPLTSPDIPALATLLPEADCPAQAVCRNFAEVFADPNGIVDITLQRDGEGDCMFLHKEGKYCKIWEARPFVCRSHFCLPRGSRLEAARAGIVNRGENELIRLLLAEEAAGAPPFLPPGLDPAHYLSDPAFAEAEWPNISMKKLVSPKLWRKLRELQ